MASAISSSRRAFVPAEAMSSAFGVDVLIGTLAMAAAGRRLPPRRRGTRARSPWIAHRLLLRGSNTAHQALAPILREHRGDGLPAAGEVATLFTSPAALHAPKVRKPAAISLVLRPRRGRPHAQRVLDVVGGPAAGSVMAILGGLCSPLQRRRRRGRDSPSGNASSPPRRRGRSSSRPCTSRRRRAASSWGSRCRRRRSLLLGQEGRRTSKALSYRGVAVHVRRDRTRRR